MEKGAKELNMTVKTICGSNNLRLSISGSLDAVTSIELKKILNECLTENVRSVVFDFKNLDYISSAGLRVILYAQKRMTNYGEFMIFNANGFVMELLETTGFANIIILDNDIVNDLPQAEEETAKEDNDSNKDEIVYRPMVKIINDEDENT